MVKMFYNLIQFDCIFQLLKIPKRQVLTNSKHYFANGKCEKKTSLICCGIWIKYAKFNWNSLYRDWNNNYFMYLKNLIWFFFVKNTCMHSYGSKLKNLVWEFAASCVLCFFFRFFCCRTWDKAGYYYAVV